MPRPKRPNKFVVESRGNVFKDGWNYRLMRVDCGKSKCKGCRGGPSHGPYWYAERKVPVFTKVKGKTVRRRRMKITTRYIGKVLKPVGDL